MTTHDRDKIIAAAKEAGFDPTLLTELTNWRFQRVQRLYAKGFEDGRQAEREECAKEAEYYVQHSTIATLIANDIRARSKK